MAVQIVGIPSHAVYLPRTVEGVTETYPGVYSRVFNWPTIAGSYQVIWGYGVEGVEAVDDLTVTPFDIVVPADSYYCTPGDVRNEAAPRILPQTDDELTAEIFKSCRDIDRLLPIMDAGDGQLKMAQYAGDLNVSQTNALASATAMQTVYRLHMGYAFFIESAQTVTGKDYSTQKPPPKFSPLARDTLLLSGFLPLGGRLWNNRQGQVYATSESTWSW